MSQRSFKYFQIAAGGTPQPLVGTTLTAAVTAPTNPDAVVSLSVADSSMFLKGDRVVIGSTGAADEEDAAVFSVPDGTHINVQDIENNHANGAYVRLGILINSLYIQEQDGNTGALFIGTSSALVKATGVFVIAKLQAVGAGVQPNELDSTRSGLANPDQLGQIWIDGTTGDKYLPSVGLI
jgi:hypothetical protein